MPTPLSPPQAPPRLPPGFHAVVLGAAGTIGRACAHAFADAGATVSALDLSAAAIVETLPEGARSGGVHAVDVTDAAALAAVAASIAAAAPVDAVVHTVGTAILADVATMDLADYRRVMAVNLDSAVHAGQAFARPMLASGRPGAFVYLSSMAGLRGEAGGSAYCAAKAGLIGFVESFAAEVSGAGIRVNAVAPGNVDSPMLRAVAADLAVYTGATAEDVYAGMASAGASHRLVTPEEVAEACLWLASPASGAVTGTTLRLDAGALLFRP